MKLERIRSQWFNKSTKVSSRHPFYHITLATITGTPLTTIIIMKESTVQDLSHIIKQRIGELIPTINQEDPTFVLILKNKVLTDPTTKLGELSIHENPVIRIMETFLRQRADSVPFGGTKTPPNGTELIRQCDKQL